LTSLSEVQREKNTAPDYSFLATSCVRSTRRFE
jgi:hypothetical protein